MKRILLIAMIMACAAASAQVKRGDVNNDNSVNTADVVEIYNIIINGEGTVQVIDMAGHIIISVDEYTRSIPTAGMTSGVYVLRLIEGDDVKTQKIVVR